jgi:predicted phosphodiesterase
MMPLIIIIVIKLTSQLGNCYVFDHREAWIAKLSYNLLMEPYRLAVIADIHGIIPPLQAVIADLKSLSPNEIMVAGDFLGGPHPKETLALLEPLNAIYLLGNGEANMLKMYHGEAPEIWWTHRQFDLARWIFNRLDDSDFTFLESLPEHWVIHPEGCDPLRVIHGAPWDINKLVFPHKEPAVFERALGAIPEDVLVFAHTHLPEILRRHGKLAVNPGSVSNNLNGDTRASYAILTWFDGAWVPELHYVSYDLQEVVSTFIETGLLEAARPLSRGFLESILTGENTAIAYILHATQKAEEAGDQNLDVVPDEIWLEAESTFPWKFEF